MTKALNLIEPYAALVALGYKKAETRSWSTSYRGPLAIVASAKVPTELLDRDIGGFAVQKDNRRGRPPTYLLHGERLNWWPYRLPLGAVVATCTLVDVVPILAADEYLPVAWQPHVAPTCRAGKLWFWKGPGTYNESTGRPTWAYADITDQWPLGDFTPGRFAWLLADIKRLPQPIPVKGRLGLWDVDLAGLTEEAS